MVLATLERVRGEMMPLGMIPKEGTDFSVRLVFMVTKCLFVPQSSEYRVRLQSKTSPPKMVIRNLGSKENRCSEVQRLHTLAREGVL